MKVICNQHRFQGYAIHSGGMFCRGCGLPASMHETVEETLKRKESEK